MKIFITGITGFVGNRLASVLIERGYEIGGLARNISSYDRPSIEEQLSGVNLFYGDVTDYHSIEKALSRFQPDVIVHLASQTSVAYSFDHPYEVINVNFMGTVYTAEAARATVKGLKSFIWSGSVEEYGNQKDFPIKEDAPLRAASPYGVAKIAAENYLKLLHDAYNFPVVIFRNANSYGRKYNYYFVVEHTIVQMLRRENQIRMGDPRPIRDFVYIDDLINGYVRAIESDSDKIYGQPMNLGTRKGVSVEELVNMIGEITGYKGEIKWYYYPPRPCEIWKIIVDNSKAKELLGWTPQYDLRSGLEKTVKWWSNVIK
ncbi:MAG: GDP-mannose 4,6-dehydratase [Halobacteria archaeon]|nr:GDP-mannose 4,6-dehydratase [Candidatus Bathyarchaeota archaeon]